MSDGDSIAFSGATCSTFDDCIVPSQLPYLFIYLDLVAYLTGSLPKCESRDRLSYSGLVESTQNWCAYTYIHVVPIFIWGVPIIRCQNVNGAYIHGCLLSPFCSIIILCRQTQGCATMIIHQIHGCVNVTTHIPSKISRENTVTTHMYMYMYVFVWVCACSL